MSAEQNPPEPQRGFFRKNEHGWIIQMRAREAAKWFLDLVRNIVVVAVLLAFASKSTSWSVWILANLAWFALTTYVVSYIQQWFFFPFPTRMASSRVWLWAGSIISGCAITGLVFLTGNAISSAVFQLSALQTVKP
jgi:hypothetical protein